MLKKKQSMQMEKQCGTLDNMLGFGVRRLRFYSCYMTVTKSLPVSLPLHSHPSSVCTAYGKFSFLLAVSNKIGPLADPVT